MRYVVGRRDLINADQEDASFVGMIKRAYSYFLSSRQRRDLINAHLSCIISEIANIRLIAQHISHLETATPTKESAVP